MVSFLVVLFKTMDIAQAFGVCSLLSYMAPGFCASPGWPNERRADAPLLVKYFYKFGSVMLVPLCFMIIPNVVHNFLIFVSTSKLEKEIWDDSKLFALWNPMVSAYISWFNSLLSFPFFAVAFCTVCCDLPLVFHGTLNSVSQLWRLGFPLDVQETLCSVWHGISSSRHAWIFHFEEFARQTLARRRKKIRRLFAYRLRRYATN